MMRQSAVAVCSECQGLRRDKSGLNITRISHPSYSPDYPSPSPIFEPVVL